MDLVLITNPVLPLGEIQTSDGLNIPVGWEPFAYDSKDQQDPFLLRSRIK